MFARSGIGYSSCFVIRVSVLQHNWIAQMKKNIDEDGNLCVQKKNA